MNMPPQKRFFDELWEIDVSSLSRLRRMGVNFMRIVVLVLKGFRKDECPLHAAALTFNSLMAIVPAAAVALPAARRLGLSAVSSETLAEMALLMPERVSQAMLRALEQLREVDFTLLAAAGALLLAWLAIQILGYVEMSFNRLWGVAAPRRFGRKFADYLSVIVVVPALLAAVTAFNLSLASPSLSVLVEARFGSDWQLYARALSLLPLAACGVAFVFLYMIMADVQIKPISSLLGGALAGAMWFGWQKLYLQVQADINHWNAVYAVFASVPIFLIWLYISWEIVLLGAEIAFALQNHSTYKMEQRAYNASAQSKIMLALSIISHAAQPLLVNVPHFRVREYARSHRVPVRLINEVVSELVAAGLLAEVSGGEGEYVLLKTPSAVHVQDVFNAMLRSGASPQSLGLERLNPAIRHVLGKMDNGMAGALGKFSITDLLQLHARLDEARPGQ